MISPTISVRFDDLRPGRERGTILRGLVDVVSTDDAAQVAGAIERAAQAADAGKWAAGFVTYDAACGLDPVLEVPGPSGTGGVDRLLPLVWFGIFDAADDAEPIGLPSPERVEVSVTSRLSIDDHHRDVESIRASIAAGDVYQVNLTHQLSATWPADPEELYRRLAWGQRSQFGCFIDLGAVAVASASPELFFERRGPIITTRPMKGTRRRGRFPGEDARLAAELRASDKDRAENVMIVDLLRNDIGRLADVGSVHVEGLFCVERYPTVWQMTSTVHGRLPASCSSVDVFRSLFPCGSVTGAPKIAAMSEITRLEPEARGVYCGAIGSFAPPHADVQARFSVAIRTAVIERDGGRTHYGSGGGITWSSDPADEYSELMAKARVLTGVPFAAFELLETMRAEPCLDDRGKTSIEIALLDRHLDRMAASAAHLSFRFDRDRAIELIADHLAALDGSARMRLRCTVLGDLHIDVGPLPIADHGPVLLTIDLDPIDERSPWLFHKTTNRSLYERRRSRCGTADDVVLVNRSGCVTETTICSIAALIDGRWLTPPVGDGCLPGVARAQALA
ncbi:MAG: aminodeoxychorismate synthase component I, partial [Acidimicrobiia bacterium]